MSLQLWILVELSLQPEKIPNCLILLTPEYFILKIIIEKYLNHISKKGECTKVHILRLFKYSLHVILMLTATEKKNWTGAKILTR